LTEAVERGVKQSQEESVGQGDDQG
jgi:hypothetical protein